MIFLFILYRIIMGKKYIKDIEQKVFNFSREIVLYFS